MFEPKDKSFDKDSLQTPFYVYRWLNSIYQFDVDLAASDVFHLCNNYFTKERSALDAEWSLEGDTGFCNPPYSNINPWIAKAIKEAEHGFTTVMLIPSFNGDLYYRQLLEEARIITQILGRISFIRPDNGQEYNQNNRGSWAVTIGDKTGLTLYKIIERDQIRFEYE